MHVTLPTFILPEAADNRASRTQRLLHRLSSRLPSPNQPAELSGSCTIMATLAYWGNARRHQAPPYSPTPSPCSQTLFHLGCWVGACGLTHYASTLTSFEWFSSCPVGSPPTPPTPLLQWFTLSNSTETDAPVHRPNTVSVGVYGVAYPERRSEGRSGSWL